MGHAKGCEPKPWQKLGGGMCQGTTTELTHLEIAMFSSAEFHVPLIHLAEFSLITFAFLYRTSLPWFRASLVYTKVQQNMNIIIGCELKSLCICGGILTTYIQVIL